MIYAGIGTRKLSIKDRSRLINIGRKLARKGMVLHTGAAVGADQAFVEGALQAGGKVVLFLPWASYERTWVASLHGDVHINILNDTDFEAFSSVTKYHPKPKALSKGALRLHARNYNIIKDTDFVLAFRRHDKKGGTEQGIRIAKDNNIPVFFLDAGCIKYNDIMASIK